MYYERGVLFGWSPPGKETERKAQKSDFVVAGRTSNMLCRFCLREGTSMRTPFSEFRSAGKPTQANTGSHQNHQVKSHQIMERANKSRQMRSQEKRIPLQKRSVYRDNTNQENCWKSTWPCFCVNSFQAKGAFLLAFTWQRYSLSLSLFVSVLFRGVPDNGTSTLRQAP